jgi:hypothetical protein
MWDCYGKSWKNQCTSLLATYHSVTCAHSPEGEVGKFNPTLWPGDSWGMSTLYRCYATASPPTLSYSMILFLFYI